MNKELAQKIVDHCRALGSREIEPSYVYLGLCSELSASCCTDEGYRFHRHINLSKFKYFSGLDDYPIDHPTLDSERAFDRIYLKKWDNSKYGNRRREYCLFVADELERVVINGGEK